MADTLFVIRCFLYCVQYPVFTFCDFLYCILRAREPRGGGARRGGSELSSAPLSSDLTPLHQGHHDLA